MMGIEGVSAADVDRWVRENHELIQQLVAAERVVDHGQIVLIRQDRRYLGMDICPRRRVRRGDVRT